MVAGTVMLFTACNNDDDNQLAGNTPLMLFAQTDAPATRATIANTWTVGDDLQVVIDSNPAETFTVQADGVTLQNPTSYWQSASQTVTARAWYPASWAMQANQSSNDGFQKADFLFAPEVSGITLANYNTPAKTLTFSHKTAKVTANLLPDPAGTVTAADISAATVRFFGYTSGTADTDNGLLSPVSSSNGEITPFKSGDMYTALLIPQDIAAPQWFIKVTINGNDYYYKPATGDANLAAGYSYTYDITVKKNELVVTANSGMTWMGGDSYTPVATVDAAFAAEAEAAKITGFTPGTNTAGSLVFTPTVSSALTAGTTVNFVSVKTGTSAGDATATDWGASGLSLNTQKVVDNGNYTYAELTFTVTLNGVTSGEQTLDISSLFGAYTTAGKLRTDKERLTNRTGGNGDLNCITTVTGSFNVKKRFVVPGYIDVVMTSGVSITHVGNNQVFSGTSANTDYISASPGGNLIIDLGALPAPNDNEFIEFDIALTCAGTSYAVRIEVMVENH